MEELENLVDPGDRAVKVRILGRVQGVWFRAWAVEEATARNLRGWVRNRRDGTVELLLVGMPSRVDDMVALCWRGPPHARVSEVVVEPAEDLAPPGFDQLPTR